MSKIVTIDGPAGSGKSTVAKLLSQKTGIPYLSTGILYRAVGLAALEAEVAPAEGAALNALLANIRVELQPTADRQGFDVVLNGRLRSGDELRSPEASQAASQFSALPSVRRKLFDLQRAAAGPAGVIVDGRDTGTVIFPHADLKVFLAADPKERARRRASELGLPPDDPATLREMLERDQRDAGREAAPLKVPEGAVVIDSTDLSIGQVLGRLLDLLD